MYNTYCQEVIATVNKFLACGSLSELRIDLFKTHVRIKLSLAIAPTNIITCQQTISRKWGEQQIRAWLDMISNLHPRIDGYMYVNNAHYYTMKKSDTPTMLLVSGNVNEYKKSLYYNMQYCRIEQANSRCGLNIEIDGQWVDNERFVNLTGEWARLFHIDAPIAYEKRLYRLKLDYSNGAAVDGDTVKVETYGLKMVSCAALNEYISDAQMKNIMLELEITGG